ncbi:Aldo/keto reductase [Sistotremastrum suecicum HHB10207 ss-3]|uniref:Aldo/keto reductase n=1 Tax=Sistotremastrum suecicum HHB10207 ss-3 TaxID=1314776 RepID=A0A166EED0_9AGAM|nr:Aldo/keto reductase [Sistotremastrum suecicum HHB10207 ss-3]
MPFETTPLSDGNEIPQIAYGTGSVWKGEDVAKYVDQALEQGFAHIDTAQYYANEDSVGTAIRQSGLQRSEFYLTTKFSDGKDVRAVFNDSLEKLGLSYVDLYLVHFPQAIQDDLEGKWRAFEQIKKEGLARSIGVSNFSVNSLEALWKVAKIKPVVNQIQFHPYNYVENKPILDFAEKHGIVVEAYSSLTPITKTPGGPVDAVLEKIGKRIGATPAQVVLSWVKSKGVVIVTTSSKKERLQEYLAVADLPPLTLEEIAEIEEAGAKGPNAGFTRRAFVRRILPAAVATALWIGFRSFTSTSPA